MKNQNDKEKMWRTEWTKKENIKRTLIKCTSVCVRQQINSWYKTNLSMFADWIAQLWHFPFEATTSLTSSKFAYTFFLKVTNQSRGIFIFFIFIYTGKILKKKKTFCLSVFDHIRYYNFILAQIPRFQFTVIRSCKFFSKLHLSFYHEFKYTLQYLKLNNFLSFLMTFSPFILYCAFSSFFRFTRSQFVHFQFYLFWSVGKYFPSAKFSFVIFCHYFYLF